ncbi:SPX-domain-containing protein [Cryphonectria parasitica EP155]|uniref:SPX-domain-containing protein n=1 Tax=Cryphonectria parasitica (strain ATCC 38755 / EP155) TaxID=660469 RepID=A0A9P4Y3X5_CRYP1|nr:SPX-domain-containing protein [Cryphonectria parasitica EP155]KAF3766243.1 SPX-domain-containing protein [Cryphonectria parasitica EP155]
MKFSHSIQFNAVPDWSSHYIAYSNLKKLIYQLEKAVHQTNHSHAGDAESRPLIPSDDPEGVFKRALDVELEKIISFYQIKERELIDEVNHLLNDVGRFEEEEDGENGTADRPPTGHSNSHVQNRQLGGRRDSAHSHRSTEDGVEEDSDEDEDGDETTALTAPSSRRRRVSQLSGRRRLAPQGPVTDLTVSTELTRSVRRMSASYDDYEQAVLFSGGIMLKKRIIGLYVQLCELKSYVQLNKTGFRKVLKKFDKILDRRYRPVYMEKYVEPAYPFQEATMRAVEENISKMEQAYTDIVTNGNEEAAKRDLRSHLREHVVWERNTVWRDLIGMERRAEAASLGRALLGRGDAIKTRLQGDDDDSPETKAIMTPVGRFTCPVWLFSSAMFTLLIILVVFFVLLFIPIMEKPEQQNCLAMLVFVSLLWATEAIPLFVTSLMIPFLCVLLNVIIAEQPPHVRLDSKKATAYIFSAMWTPVIMLLLGGFTLAAALSKCKIDKRIATFVLSKAGTTPRTVLVATMFVAAFASMLISNVAAPVLCFSIIEPMLRNLPSDSNMSKAVIMGIALASNIGGMLSPIASPQNVVALGIMAPEPGWGQWFFIVIPVGIVSICLIWLLLLVTFRPGRGTTIVPIRQVQDKFTGVQWFVSIVTIGTIALWCASHQLEPVFGDMGVIAIIPIVLFFGVGILTKEDFNNFPWTIIILAAGGLSLGKAVKSSGLLDTVAVAISHRVEGMSLYGVLVVFSCLILVIATFISHTVAALIILPLVYDVGASMEEPHPNLLVMAGVLMCSAAMGLPTSGFPNMSKYRVIAIHRLLEFCDHEGGPGRFLNAMLSAFTARPIIELKQRDKSKIETILAYGDRVLVGLNTGSLRVYRLNELEPPALPSSPSLSSQHNKTTTNGSSDKHDNAQAVGSLDAAGFQPTPAKAQPKPTDLLREVEKFSTRAIEQLAIIKEANTLVSLSNYAISLHDLQTYEPLGGCAPLARSKNASCFAVTSNIVRDTETGIPEIISRMAVAAKRKLLLWNWHESELSPDVAEVVLTEAIRTVTWASATRLVCGMNAGYVLVDVVTGTVEDVVAPGHIAGAGQGSRFGAMSSAGMGYMGLGGYVPRPLATKLADGQMLLAKDINTLFITDEGKPVPDKKQIPWQSAPEGVGYSYPYILALQSPTKGSLEVRNPDTLSLLQTVPLPGAANLHFPPPTVSLAHAGKGFHISSERVVWKMDATDYDSQIEELVGSERYDEAISVLAMLEDALLKNKTETMRSIKMQKAEVLFRAKKYRESMDLFNEDEVHAPPERVLRLFPKSIAGDLSGHPEDKESDESEDEAHHVKVVGGENGEKTHAHPHGHGHGHAHARKESDATSNHTEEVSSPTNMGGGFARMLLGHRTKANPETASITSSTKKGADTDDAGSVDGKSSGDDNSVPEGKDLKEAVLELRGFLAGTRARLQRVLDPVTGRLKLKPAQTGSSEQALRSLLSTTTGGRDESENELERHLQDTFKMVDTCLFRAYMFSAPTLASSLFRIPNFCDPDVVNEKLLEHNRYNELVDFFYGKKLHRQALELLKKFGEGDKPNDKAPGLHGPQRTVGYLQNLPPEMIDLILEFSEWTLRKAPDLAMEVFVADTENAETLPRHRIVQFLDRIDAKLEVRYLEHIITELNDLTPDFHNRLVELLVQQLKGANIRDVTWEAEMARLVRFLKESGQYSLGRAFSLLKGDDPAFYEAQAIVFSNMGEHRAALLIYVFKMQDYAKAEEYSSKGHRPSSAHDDTNDATPSIYQTLLSLYLTPPPPNKPNLEPALDLLSKHGSRLPAASTLSLIPDTLPIADLESYFRGRIRAANSAVNESRIVAGLRETEFVASQALLLLGDGVPGGQGGRNRRVVVHDERVCGVCHKRLGGSVVAALPDNTVVHYGCLHRATTTTTTTTVSLARSSSILCVSSLLICSCMADVALRRSARYLVLSGTVGLVVPEGGAWRSWVRVKGALVGEVYVAERESFWSEDAIMMCENLGNWFEVEERSVVGLWRKSL